MYLKLRFKSATINSKVFLPLRSFDGDTVWMTLFVVPILACLLPFWPSLLTHLWVLMSASNINTHCQSFFSLEGLRAFPQDSPLQSANQFSPLSPAGCPSVHVPLWPLKWQEATKGKFVIKSEVADRLLVT